MNKAVLFCFFVCLVGWLVVFVVVGGGGVVVVIVVVVVVLYFINTRPQPMKYINAFSTFLK